MNKSTYQLLCSQCIRTKYDIPENMLKQVVASVFDVCGITSTVTQAKCNECLKTTTCFKIYPRD